jgi:membrane protease YdiL (CAAX protease family)
VTSDDGCLLIDQGVKVKDQPDSWPGISFRAVLPGLAFIAVLNLVYIINPLSFRGLVDRNGLWLTALTVAFPWAYVIARRASPALLGYHRRQALRLAAWGLAVGAAWRLVDVLAGYYGWFSFLDATGLGVTWPVLIGGGVVAPLVEETFFRAFLQVGIASRYGVWAGVVVQALAFVSHPAHYNQGAAHWPAIFLFGLLTGALYARTGSIWPCLVAHGFANVLPALIALLAALLW